jgi:alpha-tubulin suppressor-like RCC1 family protein
MGRLAAVPAIVIAIALTCIAACSDGTGPRSAETSLGLIVSAPVRSPVGAVGATVPAASSVGAAATVVYVSLPPGSMPAGTQATITNQANGQSISTVVVDGGFDPVPLAASIGDTLVTEIAGPTSVVLDHVRLAVSSVRPLKVVRTSPPSGGRDVPLNAVIVMVFSEPIDPATLTAGSMQLWRDTTSVAGTVKFADALQLRVVFYPDSLLAAQTDYRLVVTQGIRDVNGVALAAPLAVPFTTGTNGPATGLVFASVSAGFHHSCGVTTNGAAYCWGDNGAGELGDGTTTSSATPVAVAGGLTFQSVSAGEMHTCGVTMDGAAYCWGAPANGDNGIDTTTWRTCWPLGGTPRCLTPLPVVGGLRFASVSAGRALDYDTCGVATDGAAYCWGHGGYGELGNGLPGYGCCDTPTAVVGGLTFVAVSPGEYFTCGLTTAGTAYCWGANGGSLGTGTATGPEQCWDDIGPNTGTGWVDCSRSPVAVAGGLSFQSISAGRFTCAVTPTGNAYCWGEIASNSYSFSAATPVPVAGNLTFGAVSVAGTHACAVTPVGAAYCWGEGGYGELGTGTATSSATPVAVVGGLAFVAVSAGGEHGTNPGEEAHTCGVTTAGVAYCWGANGYGELGDGTITGIYPTGGSSVPVKVAGQP